MFLCNLAQRSADGQFSMRKLEETLVRRRSLNTRVGALNCLHDLKRPALLFPEKISD